MTSVLTFSSSEPLGFNADDTNLTRYVGNQPVIATDPTGLTIELSVTVFVSKSSISKHEKIINDVIKNATEILANLDIKFTATIVTVPDIITEGGSVTNWFGAEHSMSGAATAKQSISTTNYVLNQLCTDKKFLAAELAKAKVTKIQFAAVIYTTGNAKDYLAYPDGKLKGIQVNLKDLIAGTVSVREVARQFAHEFLAHIILEYKHPTTGRPDPNWESGLTANGPKPNDGDECITSTVAAQLKKLGADKIKP